MEIVLLMDRAVAKTVLVHSVALATRGKDGFVGLTCAVDDPDERDRLTQRDVVGEEVDVVDVPATAPTGRDLVVPLSHRERVPEGRVRVRFTEVSEEERMRFISFPT